MRESSMRSMYVLGDYLSTFVGVVAFSLLRYLAVPDIPERYSSVWQFLCTSGVINSILFFPLFMLLAYYLTGYYVKVYNKSRITELVKTFVAVMAGAVVFFLVVLLNDVLPKRTYNYELMLLQAGTLFAMVYMVRVSLTTHFIHRIRMSGGRRAALVTDMSSEKDERPRIESIAHQHGMELVETVDVKDVASLAGKNRQGEISCVMLSSETLSTGKTLELLGILYSLDMPVYVSPDMHALIMGAVRYDKVLAEPLVDLSRCELGDTFVAVKRFMDILVSGVGLVVSAPVMAVLAVVIKRRSPGPVIYSQERVGYHRRPFHIYKLRSMCVDSEPDGPMLASTDDPRISTVGRFIRKYRLDELPNLWNVLKGEMSIVGPRPERQFYIDKIMARAPHYVLVHQVRPGLTSWGMVKYGYACDVDGMVERLKYDMLYLQNMSLSLDLRIIYYTVFTVLRGEGK